MPSDIGQRPTEEAIREQAEEWFARMRGPDAERLQPDFERWRASHPRCREEYARLERKFEFAGALRSTGIGRERKLSRARTRWFPSPAVRHALAAAALVLIVLAGSIYVRHGANVAAPAIAMAMPISSEVGQIRHHYLDDGSMITLDTDSRVQISFTTKRRFVRLMRGRARFEVAHDVARPFVVEAGGKAVTARGTTFDVSLDGSAVRVSLLRGRVDVARASNNQPGQGAVAHLAAGQALCASSGLSDARIRPLPRGEDQWVGGMLSFDGIPLSEVLAQTNRYSRAKIRLADQAQGQLKVTGAFRPLPISNLAASVAATFSLGVESAPNGDIVLHAR